MDSAVAGSGQLHIRAPRVPVTAPGPAGGLTPTENPCAATSFPSAPPLALACPNSEPCHQTPALGQRQAGGASSQETENTQGRNRLGRASTRNGSAGLHREGGAWFRLSTRKMRRAKTELQRTRDSPRFSFLEQHRSGGLTGARVFPGFGAVGPPEVQCPRVGRFTGSCWNCQYL